MTGPTEAVPPDQWGELERLARKCTDGDPWYAPEDVQGPFIPQDRAFIAAAKPAAVLELIAAARSVGIGPLADEPQNNPHPGRGEDQALQLGRE